MVIGARPIDETEHFSFIKKKLQPLLPSLIIKYSISSIPSSCLGRSFNAISNVSASLKQGICMINFINRNRVNFESLMISDTIRELGKEMDKVVYLEEGRPELAGFLQMQIPDRTIHMIKPEALENGKEKARFVISGIETANREQLKEQYEKEVATGTFYLYFDISEDDL